MQPPIAGPYRPIIQFPGRAGHGGAQLLQHGIGQAALRLRAIVEDGQRRQGILLVGAERGKTLGDLGGTADIEAGGEHRIGGEFIHHNLALALHFHQAAA